MQVSTETKEGLNRVLTVTVPAEEVSKAYAKSFKKVAGRARLDGFRKGHIPTKILEQNFGGDIFMDCYNNLIQQTIDKAIEEKTKEIMTV